ncbi:MAG: DUF3667 domain-containing protein [Mizugakiibacter sp.]|uniref:DUF3667 domain-containing protein n=1 Tax=Mizugakiibacter sp. TaxID=1972610 RepID=UPI0031C8644B|nr:DUF3667 domain-containing protein [Xanthomonadaceae bacterium]
MNTPNPAPATSPARGCANCGAPLSGPYCYACGQPVRGMVRPLSGLLADLVDTVFNIDSRILRTLGPLLLRPGFLTREYFAGRRQRYVTPVRLYFFLSIVAFLMIQWTLAASDLGGGLRLDGRDSATGSSRIAQATSLEDLDRDEQAALRGLREAQQTVGNVPGAAAGLAKAEAKVRDQAERRRAYLRAVADAKAKGLPPPPEPAAATAARPSEDTLPEISFGGGPAWDAVKNPIRIGWLPSIASQRLNDAIAHALQNVKQMRHDPKPVILGLMNVLPQTLFVVMPLFAVMLKLFYLFKRRLYMEHLVVALHSHAFIFLTMLLLVLFGLLGGWAHAHAAWLMTPLRWVSVAAWIWLFLYLLLMQKRVYGQGWFMTVLKYGVIGLCYTVLISFGLAAAFIVSLATT